MKTRVDLREKIYREQLHILEQFLKKISVRSEIEQHTRYLFSFAEALSKLMNLPAQDVHFFLVSAALHDLGKTLVPERILQKKSSLTSSEFNMVKLHPVIGLRTIEAAGLLVPQEVKIAIHHHHETPDGSGYYFIENPTFLSRLLAVCDAYSAMIFPRSYRRAMSKKEAIRELISYPNKFDQKIVAVLEESQTVLNKEEASYTEFKNKLLNSMGYVVKLIS